MSAPGIDVVALADGNVRIEADSGKGRVKLTVSAEYARQLAQRLTAVAGGQPTTSPGDEFARAIADRLRRGG